MKQPLSLLASLLLVLLLVPLLSGTALADTPCPMDAGCPAAAFSDVTLTPDNHDGLHYCLEQGLMSAQTETLFGADKTLTRFDLVVILWKMEGCPGVNYAMSFRDIDTNCFESEAVRWAQAMKVTNGYSSTCFSPNDPLTREQMATMLWRYAQFKGYDVSVGEDTNILSYDDAFDVSDYAYPALQWSCGSGVLSGLDAQLLPAGNVTRMDTAAIIHRFCTTVCPQ